ncbi:MAG: tetratricopeptide repeat protein [Anaerolineae bacterium]|nr:tetratricopeptide repeat protein [Anaerolineae bacterium]
MIEKPSLDPPAFSPKGLGLRFVLLVVAGMLLFTPLPTLPGLAAVRAGEQALADGAFTAAERQLLQAQTELPATPEVTWRLIELYTRWERFEKGLALLPDTNPDPYRQRLALRLLAGAGEWATVEQQARDYLAEFEVEPEIQNLQIKAQLQQGKCAAAARSAAEWYAISPTNHAAAEVWGILTVLETTAAPTEGAAILCDAEANQVLCTTLRTCLSPAECTTTLGLALLRQGEFALAACMLESATELTPTSSRNHLWLGAALERTGRSREALPHLSEATRLDPTMPAAWLLLGIHQLNAGELNAAVEALQEAHRLDPANPLPCLSLAAAAAAEARYLDVPVWTYAALERAPDDAEVWKSAARLYLERSLELEDEPLHAAEGAVALAPDDAEAWMLLGRVRLNNADLDGGLAALQEAVARDANYGESYYWIGRALELLGKRSEARRAFEQAADLGFRNE